MKKAALVFVLTLTAALTLAGCQFNFGQGSGDKGFTSVVVPADDDGTVYSGVGKALKEMGYNLPTYNDKMELGKREIVLGSTNRQISKTAYEKLVAELERRDVLSEWDATGYIIYAEGGSIAVCWYGDYATDEALAAFIDGYIKTDKLELSDGVVKVVADSYISILEREEALVREAELAKIASDYSEQVATAISNHLSMFDDRYYIWLANLYDSGEYDENGNAQGGGFYFSNSGRDNEGFLPDIESTRQVLSFITASGMIDEYEGLADAIPEKMQKEMVAFAKSLQSSEDGYFYHTQWGTNVSTSRLSRDLSNCTSVLNSFGAKPNWNTPNGVAGEFGAPPGAALTASFGNQSQVRAVSKVVMLAGERVSWPSHLKTLEAFHEYLEKWADKIETDSYSIGNTISSQAAQITSRDKEAVKYGDPDLDGNPIVDEDENGIAENGFVREFERFFNEHAHENGTWEDHTESMTYQQVNGLMKISSAYNSLKVKLPYPEASLEAAIYVASLPMEDCTGDTPNQSVDVYNPWVSINSVISNVKNQWGDKTKSAAMKEMLRENALELIEVTTSKISRFLRDDGSASYNVNGNCPNSQGSPVAVKGVVEGDVNGGNIAFTSTFSNMCSALGIDIRIFFASDYHKFLHEIDGLSPVHKQPIPEREPEVITFEEDYAVGDSDIADITDNMKGGYISVQRDPVENGSHGNVLMFSDTSSGEDGNSITVAANGNASTATCFVADFDVFLEGMNKNATFMRWTINSCYRIRLSQKDGKIHLYDDTNNFTSDLGIKIDINKWYNFRFEYYLGEADTVMIKIFIDGDLRAVTTNFYGKESDGSGTPASATTGLNIYSYYPVVHNAYFDNILVARTTDKYVEEPIVNLDRVKDFESCDVGGALPDGVVSVGSGSSPRVASGSDGKYLELYKNGSGVGVSAVASSSRINAYVLELDLTVDAAAEGAAMTFYMDNGTLSKAICAFALIAEKSGSEYYLSIAPKTAEGISDSAVGKIASGDTFKLRIEYFVYRFDTDVTTVVYIDGEEVGRFDAYYSANNLSNEYTRLLIEMGSAADAELDNIVAERLLLQYSDENGNPEQDPDTPFPSGGKPSSTPPDSNHTGVFDFDGDSIGLPAVSGLTTTPNSAEVGNEIYIAESPTDDGNALHIKSEKSTNSANNHVIFIGASELMNESCLVFEAKFYIVSSVDVPIIQIMFGNESGAKGIVGFNYRPAAGTIHTRYSPSYASANGLSQQDALIASNITPDSDGWITLRIEYYTEENIAKCYINGVFTGEDETFYDGDSDNRSCSAVKILLTTTTKIEFYMDDVTVTSIAKQYSEG